MAGLDLDFMAFMLLHVIATGIFLLVDLRGKTRIRAFTEAAIVLFVPVFGLLIMCLFKLMGSILGLWEGQTPELESQGEAFFTGTQVDDDIVPLNDAFLVEDQQRKRRFFTEAIKQSMVENKNILQMAMHDKDREIAYYAVSMLTTRMEKLETQLFEGTSGVLSGKEQENLPLLQKYADLLKEYISQRKFIDHVTWRRKQGDYVGLLAHLTKLCPDNMEYYSEEIKQLISMGDYTMAEQAAEEFMQAFPQREEPYLKYIELYAAWKRPEELQQKLSEMKACPMELTPEALRVIRYWDRGAVSHG